jgi:Flp pilus assembly protein TadD/2-polyprenyl-3-methyl-5-hydroxy-6-metoxy-1,4-benzoquinol methylase
MNRKERRAAQKRSGPTMSPMAAALADAFRAHQAGHRSDAERLYRDVLSAEPRNAAAMHLLGALMHQSGRSEEAISLIQQAIAIDPRDPDYRYNLGCILLAAGKPEEAIQHLEKAIALKPGYAAAHFELGNALARLERLPEAEKNLRRVIELQPGNAELHNNLGLALMGQGRSDEAMAALQRALQLQPNFALAHFNMGLAEMNLGRPADAEASFRRAIEARPDYPEAMPQLATSLLLQDKTDEAYRVASEALSKHETNEIRSTFATCLLRLSSFNPDGELRDRLRRAIEEAWHMPSELAPLCASVLKAHPVIGPAVVRVSEQWQNATTARQHPIIPDAEIAATDEPLFRSYLEATPNCDIGIERFLIALRANLLDRAVKGEAVSERVLNSCAALARQCFVNEYVFSEITSETERASQLAKTVQSAISGGAPIAPFQLAALAMYQPLGSLEGAERLLQNNWPVSVAALVRQQIAEPAQEAALRRSTPRLTEIDDKTSGEVQKHYEEHPYPRWVSVSSTIDPLDMREIVRRSVPREDCPALAPVPSPDILIAGCGTGLQAIAAAKVYANARLLAIDLSATSLAYARRQAAQLNLTNVEFAQADILKLNSLGRSFDVIECGGVLHHLADPFAGWQILLSLLRPGGLMRVALYSEIARRNVVAARDFAAAGNYQPDLEGIRLCRQAILKLKEDAKERQIMRTSDFFSTSAFRDLVMHGHEQRMSLPQIQAFLAANKLEFIGFETNDPTQRAFASRFPDPAARKDLASWHQFETENPDAFFAMYSFWLRKPLHA